MNNIYKLPLIGEMLTDLDKDTLKYGLKTALNNLIKKTESKLEVKMPQETANILKKKGVVIVANHPNEVEAYAVLASLPARENIYLIISSNFLGVIPNIDKHLIPVYLDHHNIKERTRKLSAKINNFFTKPVPIAKKEAHTKNIQSIKIAAEKVRQGGIVVIFPEGFRGHGGRWFDGIGYLLKEIGDTKNTYLIKAHIKGSSNLDYFRLIPFIRKFLPKIIIYYSLAEKISETVKGDKSGKAIRNKLEYEYNKWVELLR